jgi:solute carrier family 36 (proton-coupled amino acid transporter)
MNKREDLTQPLLDVPYSPVEHKKKVAKRAHLANPDEDEEGKSKSDLPRLRGRSMSALTDEHEYNPKRKLNVEEYYYLHLWGENLHDCQSDSTDAAPDDTWTPEELLKLKLAEDEEKELLKAKLEISHLKKLSDFATFFTLVKGFVATGVLFLPNGFYNGGWLFSTIWMIFSMILTLICLLMLIIANEKVGGSYSELGFKALGKPGKIIWDITLALSQFGFCTVQTIFIYQNFNEILGYHFGFRLEHWKMGVVWFFIYTPLTWVRKIQKFAKYHLFADIAIGLTLLVIIIYGLVFFQLQGGFSTHVTSFNQDKYFVFFGTSIYVFEGIGIVLPVKDSTQNPERFKYILIFMMWILTFFLLGFGIFNYLVYGAYMLADAPLITRVLPSGQLPIEMVLLLFMASLFIGFPLVIHPTNMVVESYIYKNMKQSIVRKWSKNITRTIIVAMTIVVGLALEESLDRLMSVVGSLACTPVAFILPAIFHLKLVAKSTLMKIFDTIILIIGIILLIFMSGNTLLTW